MMMLVILIAINSPLTGLLCWCLVVVVQCWLQKCMAVARSWSNWKDRRGTADPGYRRRQQQMDWSVLRHGCLLVLLCDVLLHHACKSKRYVLQSVVDSGSVAYLAPLVVSQDAKLKRQVGKHIHQCAAYS